MVDAERFDFDELFDDDYLHFYRPFLTDDVTDDEADLIRELAGIEPGMNVLDLACGYGRIANRLAERGARVVGIDRAERFVEAARRDAVARGVSATFRTGDMRRLDACAEYDVVVSWFTAFGYHDDASCRDVLRRIHAALRPDGRLLLETINRDLGLLTTDERPTVKEVGGEFMIDLARFDPLDGRLRIRRFVARNDAKIREMRYFVRLFSFTELRDWLRDAGFVDVQGFGGDGEVYRLDSSRMILVAQK